MPLHEIAARLRAILAEESEFATVLRGAGLAVVIRVLASGVGYASLILLARWMGSSEYGHYSFAIAWMILLAYPATLGLPGVAVRFVAQYAAARDWAHVIGLLKMSSWLTLGSSTIVALVAILVVLYLKSFLDPGYVAPMIVALAGIPIVALSVVRSEAIRGLGRLALAWGPLLLGQPLLLLILAAATIFITHKLSATLVVGASILAYAAMLIAQTGLFRTSLGTRVRVEPKVNVRLWLRVALSFVWIYIAVMSLTQAGVIMVGILLTPKDVAIYAAAAATALLVTFPLQATNALSAPRFSALHAQQYRVELQALVTNVVRWSFWPSLAIAFILSAFGSTILRLFGPDFEQGYSVLLILTLGHLVSAFTGPVVNLLSMTGHQAVTARVVGTTAILSVALGLAFTRMWGIVGTALAFSGGMVLWNAWLAILVVWKLDIYPPCLRPQSFLR